MSYCHVDPKLGKTCKLHLHEEFKNTPVELPDVEDASPNIADSIIPETLKELSQSFIDYAEEIIVDNNSDTGDETVTLYEILNNDKLLINNCGPVTWALMEQLTYDDMQHMSYSEHTIQYRKGVHVALLAESTQGEQYIIDLTARQYNPELPCPFIAKRYEWEQTIDYYVRELYNDERI